jgi:hypothetical protein
LWLNRLFFCSNKDCGNCSTIELSAEDLSMDFGLLADLAPC